MVPGRLNLSWSCLGSCGPKTNTSLAALYDTFLHFALTWSLVTHTGSTALGMSVTLIRTRFRCIYFICVQIFRNIHAHFTFCLRDLWSPTQGQPRLACPWLSFEPGSTAYTSYASRFLGKYMRILNLACSTQALVCLGTTDLGLGA